MTRDKKMTLTEKQKRFIDEYLIDLNATAAAVRAGYSKKNAGKIGPRLVGESRITQALADRLHARMKRTEVTQDYVLHNLKEIVERCILSDSFDARGAAKALELLGRHLGMFTDKIKLDGALTVSGVLDELAKRRGGGDGAV